MQRTRGWLEREWGALSGEDSETRDSAGPVAERLCSDGINRLVRSHSSDTAPPPLPPISTPQISLPAPRLHRRRGERLPQVRHRMRLQRRARRQHLGAEAPPAGVRGRLCLCFARGGLGSESGGRG